MSNRGYDVLHDLIESGQLVADQENHTFVFADSSHPIRLTGSGNTGPRANFSVELFNLSDEEFMTRAETVIWLSAWAANNPISDYHWQADVCYNEATRRGNPDLYNQAWERASRTAG